MRQSSHNTTARRYFSAGIVALSISVTAVVFCISGDTRTTTGHATAAAGAPEVVVTMDRGVTTGNRNIKNAVAVSGVVRTGATAATATVTGSATATGASAVALPNTSGSETVLAMCGVFLTLCAAAAFALVRTSRREHRTH